MQHKLKLTLPEKFKACLDLSDFIFNMMRNSMSKSEFDKKLRNLREKHLKEDQVLLKNLGAAIK